MNFPFVSSKKFNLVSDQLKKMENIVIQIGEERLSPQEFIRLYEQPSEMLSVIANRVSVWENTAIRSHDKMEKARIMAGANERRLVIAIDRIKDMLKGGVGGGSRKAFEEAERFIASIPGTIELTGK